MDKCYKIKYNWDNCSNKIMVKYFDSSDDVAYYKEMSKCFKYYKDYNECLKKLKLDQYNKDKFFLYYFNDVKRY